MSSTTAPSGSVGDYYPLAHVISWRGARAQILITPPHQGGTGQPRAFAPFNANPWLPNTAHLR